MSTPASSLEALRTLPAAPGRALGLRVLRWALTLAVTFAGLLALTFVIGRKVPIDPVLAILGDRASADAYAAERIALGLDKLATQFLIYARDVLHGNLGMSLLTANPVLDDIRRVFPATLELATIATLIGIAIGVPLGVAAAVKHNRPIDHVARFVGLIGNSVPVFWLGLMGLLLFYARLHWVGRRPARSRVRRDGRRAHGQPADRRGARGRVGRVPQRGVAHRTAGRDPRLLLGRVPEPDDALVHARPAEPGIHRHRAREGPVGRRVIWRHAFGNIMVPLLTVIALTYSNLLEGSVLTEIVFAWPETGSYLTGALLNADMNAVLGATLVIGAMFITVNLLTDALYRVFDPRAR